MLIQISCYKVDYKVLKQINYNLSGKKDMKI